MFVDLLLRWNQRINLVGGAGCEEIWSRHILDSLQLLPLMPTGVCSAIDVGSGGGFPGLVLALASEVRFHLVEVDKRKGAFLIEAGRLTNTNLAVHSCRVQDVKLDPAGLVTSRALAPLNKLLELVAPVLAPTGVCLFLKGRRVLEEIDRASACWTMKIDQHRSVVDPTGVVLQVSEIMRA